MKGRWLLWFGVIAGISGLILLGNSCRNGNTAPSSGGKQVHNHKSAACMCPGQGQPVGVWTEWPKTPQAKASSEFWKKWGDGKAEMSSYQATVPRYGQLRKAELVLIYVTEPMDRKTWIKDDNAAAPRRIPVLKLNYSLKFLTGIYPYSVLTSVFAPVDQWRALRFSPAKISITVQEWCGHVYASVWPSKGSFLHQLNSYFASEGEHRKIIPTPGPTLYEDALMIQLRELDGAFADGKTTWRGKVVPSLWRNRKRHQPLRPHTATIQRGTVTRDQQTITRFVLKYPELGFQRTFEVEQTGARRLLGWTSSDGEKVTLQKTLRLPYWQLNGNNNTNYRKQLGL